MSVRSKKASFALSLSSSVTVTSRFLFSLRKMKYSATEDRIVIQ